MRRGASFQNQTWLMIAQTLLKRSAGTWAAWAAVRPSLTTLKGAKAISLSLLK